MGFNTIFLLSDSSQPARAVWIEIALIRPLLLLPWSQPARAVWIEIIKLILRALELLSQPARAVWIEISKTLKHTEVDLCHSLRGLCGLKFC